VDLSSKGRITFTGRATPGDPEIVAEYERLVITISSIVFGGKGVIGGVKILDGKGVFWDPFLLSAVDPIVTFTTHSAIITYDIRNSPQYRFGDLLKFAEGQTSSFQIQQVPEPGGLAILGLAGAALWRRRRRARERNDGA
jgi:hypothetical protein